VAKHLYGNWILIGALAVVLSACGNDNQQSDSDGGGGSGSAKVITPPYGGEVTRDQFYLACQRFDDYSDAACNCLSDGAMEDLNDGLRAVWIVNNQGQDTQSVAEAYGLQANGQHLLAGFIGTTATQCMIFTAGQ